MTNPKNIEVINIEGWKGSVPRILKTPGSRLDYLKRYRQTKKYKTYRSKYWSSYQKTERHKQLRQISFAKRKKVSPPKNKKEEFFYCEGCHIHINRYRQGLRKIRGKYCSRRCYESQPKSEEFKLNLSKYHLGKPKLFNRKEFRTFPDSRITKQCAACSKEIKVYSSAKKHYQNSYCSNQCRIKSLIKQVSGKNNYRWKGGFCRYRGVVWRRLALECVKRDYYTCQSCNKQLARRRLIAHHRIARCSGGQDTLVNLITLCKPCHLTIHNLHYNKDDKHITTILANGWDFE